MYVVTLSGFTPPARFDGLPYTHARIDEGPSADGPWETIDTLELLPIDSEPEDPATRNFTTEAATLPSGWYRVSFIDGTGDEAQMEPVPRDPSWLPVKEDIAALLPTRLQSTDGSGQLQTTFNELTRPTGAQVERLITEAAAEVGLTLSPEEVPEAVHGRIRSIISLGAAMNVELTYYPEQVAGNRSPYAQMERRFNAALKLLGTVAGQDADNEPGEAGYPSGGGFPTTAIGMETPW